jgi:YegS/Rv2252/BmrU family lipid kinase
MAFQKIHVIINPAAGQNEPILNTLNEVFQKYEINWQVSITQGPGDAVRLAEEAAAGGDDLIAGYGGDGTLMEVANGLRGSGLPLGILPGGTGNSIAREMRIPFNLAEAAELLCQAPAIRQIDLGQVNDQYFLLHVYTGLDPSQLASRESKNSLGAFAYLLPTLRVIKESQLTHYSLTIDGEEIESEGIICVLVNALGVGIELPFAKQISPEDRMLDLFLFKKDAPGALNSLLNLQITDEIVQHWQGREFSIECEPQIDVWIDGEAGGQTPFTAVIAPHPLRIIVPDE